MPRVRVGLCGLGRVGAGYPPVSGIIRNHLAAIRATPGLVLAAVADRDPAARAVVQRQHDLEGICITADVSEWTMPIDVLVDATNSPDRTAMISAAASAGAKVTILEKPAAHDLHSGLTLWELSERTGISVIVNFHRQMDRRHRRSRPVTAVTGVHAWISGGLLNYGSHLIDLILTWCGPIDYVTALGPDDSNANPHIDFAVRFRGGGTGTVCCVPKLGWDVFEVRFIGPFGTIEMINGGADIVKRHPVADLIYPTYTHLDDDRNADRAAVGGLAELYEEIAAWGQSGGPVPGVDLTSSLVFLAVIDAVRQSALKGGTPIRPIDPFQTGET